MSTRCNIILKEGNRKCYIYKHHDGYPEYTGQVLKDWLETKPKDGGSHWYINYLVNEMLKTGIEVTYTNGTKEMETEFEWTSGLHGDIEYAYVIDCKKKTLTCYERKNWGPVKEIINPTNIVTI